MHQYQTLVQILLFLSIFNLVLAAPVVREIYDTRDDMAVPFVVRNVGVMSKERRQSSSEGPTPSHSSLPPPDGLTRSHSSPALLDGSTRLQSSPASPDGSVPSHSSMPLPDGPMPSHSLPPVAEAAALPAIPGLLPAHFQSDMSSNLPAVPPQSDLLVQEVETYVNKIRRGIAILGIAGGVVLLYHHYHHHHHRAIDSDWYVYNPSHLS